MMLPRGKPLLLPASPGFIWASLLVTCLLEMLPLGRLAWRPDLLAVVLVFWSVHQPRHIGLAAGFVFGLAMDVQQASLLGQHALVYDVLIYCAIMVQRRLPWFSVPMQAVQLLPLFALAHLVSIGLRLMDGSMLPGWDVLFAPLLEAALWLPVRSVLLAPQRRAPNPDATRPL